MTELRATIHDHDTGRQLEARVQVLAATGQCLAPADALHKVGGGEPFFYAEGAFAVDCPRGQADILVERGTEYRPLRVSVDVPASGALDLDLVLQRALRSTDRGWYAGNTHVHYNETEQRAEQRLRLDPRVEDLPVFIVSHLQRRELAYASNAFPLGRHALSSHEHIIDVGEESRHNDEPWRIGYGHIMLINITRHVEPLSRGILVDDSQPDYPPLIDACAAGHAQGGLVLWCHNANGMEAPVAAALGHLDGLNLFDPYWMDPEYDLWYRLLNCGLKLPASTGSDWFVCSSNRVYVDCGATFSYEHWLERLRAGKTLVTNGPLLHLTVQNIAPSNDLLAVRGSAARLEVVVDWEGLQPIDRVELIQDGRVVASADNVAGELRGHVRWPVDSTAAGWLAARCSGRRRTTYGHALWAHTSPVYLRTLAADAIVAADARFFIERIDGATHWIRTRARLDSVTQRDRLLELYGGGREHFARLANDG